MSRISRSFQRSLVSRNQGAPEQPDALPVAHSGGWDLEGKPL